MDKHSPGRRIFLKKMTALGAPAVPIVGGLEARPRLFG